MTRLLVHSLGVASASALLAVLAGWVVGVAALGTPRRWIAAWTGAGIAVLMLPQFIVASAWLEGSTRWRIGPDGSIGTSSFVAAAFALASLLWPIPAGMVFASWRRLSPSLIDAEPRMRGWTLVKTLLWGAGRTPTAGAAFICFALALANFTIPVLFQIPVFSERIWLAFNVRLDAVEALQNALPCLVVVLAFLWVAHARGWREPAWPAAVMDEGLDELRSRVGLWGGMAVAVAFGILAISLLWPLYTWLGAERTWVEIASAWAAGQAAVWRSLGNAATTATLAVATAAWLVSRKKVRHERLGLLGPGLWVPFLLPGVVLGIAVNHFTSRWAGDSEWPVIVSLFLRYFGFAFVGMAAVVRSLDTDQLHALRLVSGSWWPTWRAVLWPQAGPRILAVWYIVYLLALWDVETGIVVAPPGGETLAMRIFNLLHYGHASQVKALCVILTGLGLLPGAIIQLVSLTTGQRLRHTTGHSS